MISGPAGRFVGLRGPFCVLWCYLPSWFAGCLAERAQIFHPLWRVVKIGWYGSNIWYKHYIHSCVRQYQMD